MTFDLRPQQPPPPAEKLDLFFSYVVEDPETRQITDMVSFYALPSSILGNDKHKTLHAAYAYYYFNTKTPLQALMSYSSIASAFGNVAQANYAAGNASLDSFALARSASGLAAGSLQLPLVKDAGMGAAHLDAKQMTYRGMNAMSLDQYAACVAMQLASARGGFSCGAHVPLPARGLLQNVPSATQPLFIELAGAKPSVAQVAAASVTTIGPTVTSPLGTQLLAMAPSKREAHVEGLIVAAVSDLAESAEVSATTPLMDAGIDSLAATELAGRLLDMPEIGRAHV